VDPPCSRCLTVASRPRFSIIVPAHNEEALLPSALEALRSAVVRSGSSAEIVVVANRCTDATQPIAEAAGAVVVVDEHRNIAATRNAGIAASTGEVVVTIDADTVIHPDALVEVGRLVDSGAFVGGGCSIVMERNSLGLAVTGFLMRSVMVLTRSGAVMFWCRRDDFDAIGGFDETLRIAEDLDFARRLRQHGRTTKRRFRNVRSAPATVCVRKWDRFGDWHYFTRVSAAAMRARNPREADVRLIDEYFYDYNA
jgi:glycosyltransferase involved in cell wall biosynthesis